MTWQLGRCAAAAMAALTMVALVATVASAAERVGDLVIDTPWTRATPPAANVAAGYLTITNTGATADRLIGGSAPFADRVEIHEMAMDDGVMRMRELDRGLALPPGETVNLEPGGFHVMFMALGEPLAAGTTVRATLRFERAGAVELAFPVAPLGATAPAGD